LRSVKTPKQKRGVLEPKVPMAALGGKTLEKNIGGVRTCDSVYIKVNVELKDRKRQGKEVKLAR